MRLSDSLIEAAEAAEADANDAIKDGDPESAASALRRAKQYRRLARNHALAAELEDDPSLDPRQIIAREPDWPADLRRLFAIRGMTQREAAAELGVNLSTIVRWLSGQQQPDVRARAAIRALAERPMPND